MPGWRWADELSPGPYETSTARDLKAAQLRLKAFVLRHDIRYPAKVSRHLHLRLEKLPTAIQAISWKAQVRLCKQYRQLMAKGKNAHQVVVAMARECSAFMWAIVKQVVVPPKA
jgi:hypothetical protein